MKGHTHCGKWAVPADLVIPSDVGQRAETKSLECAASVMLMFSTGGSANRELGWTTVEKECVSLVNAPTVPYEQPTHAFVLGLSFPTKEPKLGAIASRETV